MLVLLAVLMAAFMVAAALSIDMAQMQLARTELRSATDAASKAAAEALSRTQSRSQARQRGQAIAAENKVNGQPLLLRGSDFQFGRSEQTDPDGAFVFSADRVPINSVRVTGSRTRQSRSGPIPFFLGNVLGVEVFEPSQRATATYLERDVVLVVDRSGSMQGDKFADLQDALQVFVETLDDTPVSELVALASYSDNASADVALTDDLQQITTAMQQMRTAGFTSISRGMEAGRQLIQDGRSRDFVERTMIVMTDGLHNRGPEPRDVAFVLADQQVVIHTITFGADADRRRMAEVASIGSGRHFHADDGLQLQQIYRQIALTLTTMITE